MNEIIVKENAAPVAVVVEDYKKIAIQWLTSTGNLNKFTENEKAQFCDICAAYNLNPIKKEVYGVKYKDKFNLIVGYESYIKRAERSGRLDGWNVEVLGSGNDLKAVITIYRKDWEKPFSHEVYFEEYTTGMNLWATKPRTMLKKVAIAQGFRMCFSEELGGIPYTREELPDEMTAEQFAPLSAETAPTVKAEALKLSETKPENLTPAAPKEKKLVTKNDLLTIKLFTDEQAQELGNIMNSTFSDGSPIFSAEDKSFYRDLLMNGEFENAIIKAKEEQAARLADSDTPIF